MPRTAIASFLLLFVCGCSSRVPAPRTSADAAMFGPVSMRIHPIFSGIKDWNGDGKPDGIEALLEFQDQFGDPTKAAGTVIFELFNYTPRNSDPRGDRVVNPWVGSLQTLADQQARWNRTSRTYLFQLEYPGIRLDRSYILTAEFDTGTTRFFDQIVLEGHPKPTTKPTTKPATRPSSQPATEPSTMPTTMPTTEATNVAFPASAPATRGADVTSRP